MILGYQTGRMAKKKVDEARQLISQMINPNHQEIDPNKEITFTSGGTESNYLAMYSAISLYTDWVRSKSQRANGSSEPSDKNIPHVITTNIEHVATDLPLRRWEKEGKIEVSYVTVEKSNGRVAVDKLMTYIQNNTCLVSVMFANNETGVIQPVAEITEKLKIVNEERKTNDKFPILSHSDAAQVFGKVPIEICDSFSLDFLSICGHKFYGPRIGALYHRISTCSLYPLFLGGGQEFGRRSGTENTPMIVGLGEAARQVYHRIDKDQGCLQRIRNSLEDKLCEKFGEKVRINFPRKDDLIADREYRLPNTTSVSFQFESAKNHFTGKDILAACDGKLEASTASACHTENSNTHCGSPILIASGISPERAKCTLRLSVGRYTRLEKDIDLAVTILWNAYEKLCKN